MACKRSAVRSRLAPPVPSCRSRPHRLVGLGHRPFTAATGVRIPLGTPLIKKPAPEGVGFFISRVYGIRTPYIKFSTTSPAGDVEQRSLATLARRARRTAPSNPLRDATNKKAHSGWSWLFYFVTPGGRREPLRVRPVAGSRQGWRQLYKKAHSSPGRRMPPHPLGGH